MSIDLRGKPIIITGASSGIGAATALACSEAGMPVVMNGRRVDALDGVADRIRSRGGTCVTVIGDVTEEGMSNRLLDTAEDEYGSFHAVFANAGYGVDQPFLSFSERDFRRMFEVNFFAACSLVRAAGHRLVERGESGHLLMCSSCVSKFTVPRAAAYSATKAAQDSICGALRHEVSKHGIWVSSVHPVTTRTGFFTVASRMGGREEPAGGIPHGTPGFLVQSPERVARAIVRCLRRPRGEVWTSLPTRGLAALFVLLPWLHSVIIGRLSHHLQSDPPLDTDEAE